MDVPLDPSQSSIGVSTNSRSSFLRVYLAYLFTIFLLMLPSCRMWLQPRLDVVGHNFDYFGLGTTPAMPWLLAAGRLTQALLLALMGWLFYRLATRHQTIFQELAVWHWAAVMLGPVVICFLGLPWMNPDAFYYIGEGWLESHYQVNPFQSSISHLANPRMDEMFRNIDPALFRTVGNYSPLHQNLCATLASLSGGNIYLAVFLFKLSNFAFLLGSTGSVYALATDRKLHARHLSFCYLCNPLILLCFVAWMHNDVQQNCFSLLALLCVQRRRPFLAGCGLGAAVGFKYVGLILLPALLVYWMLAEHERQPTLKRRMEESVLSLVGFLLVLGLPYALYDGAWKVAISILTTNWSPFRSSIYYLLSPLASLFDLGITMDAAKRTLTLLYVGVGATLTLYPLLRRQKQTTGDFAQVGFWLYMGYFTLCAPAVLEWYLTWMLGLAFFCGDKRYSRFMIVLSSIYLPLVIYTSHQPNFTAADHVNVVLYLVVAVGGIILLCRQKFLVALAASRPLLLLQEG